MLPVLDLDPTLNAELSITSLEAALTLTLQSDPLSVACRAVMRPLQDRSLAALAKRCLPQASQSLGGCRELCWRVNAKPVDQSLALRSNLHFGAADLPRDLFVRLALGQAPRELLFATAEDQSGHALRTGWLIVTELVAAGSHVPGFTLPNRRQRAQFGDAAMPSCYRSPVRAVMLAAVMVMR